MQGMATSPPPKGIEDAKKRGELPREEVKPGRAERARGQWAKSQQSRDEEGANRRVGYRDQVSPSAVSMWAHQTPKVEQTRG